jgi:hypothetical protein
MDADTRTWDRLYRLLAEDDPDQLVYGYRVDATGNAIKPYLFCWLMHDNLIDNIRDQYGGGEYRLLIRKGRQMVFSGIIGLAAPLRRY